MNPLEEKLVELLQAHKEENGINALHYLEAFYTLSRVVVEVFDGKRWDLVKTTGEMLKEGEKDTELFDRLMSTLNVYHYQHKHLKGVQGDIEKSVKLQEGSNWLEELIQSKRQES